MAICCGNSTHNTIKESSCHLAAIYRFHANMYVQCCQICVSREPRDSSLHLKYSGSNIDYQNFKKILPQQIFSWPIKSQLLARFSLQVTDFQPFANNFQLVTQFAPDFREQIFSFPSLSMRLAVSYMAFIMLRYVSSICTLLTVFFIFF